MQVLTLLTDIDDKGFNAFLKPSCDHHNLDLIVLQPEGEYEGHRTKDMLLLEHLQDVSRSEIIFFSDGHDTSFLAGEAEILKVYKSFNAPLVFSAEINCWPTDDVKPLYPTSSHHFKYLNSGAFIGEAGFIRDLYKKHPLFSSALDPAYCWSNQYFWHHVYLKNQHAIKLDHDCKLFYNTSILYEKIKGRNIALRDEQTAALVEEDKIRLNDEITFLDNRIRSNITGTYPCHIHFPGPISKCIMDSGYFDALKAWESMV